MKSTQALASGKEIPVEGEDIVDTQPAEEEKQKRNPRKAKVEEPTPEPEEEKEEVDYQSLRDLDSGYRRCD